MNGSTSVDFCLNFSNVASLRFDLFACKEEEGSDFFQIPAELNHAKEGTSAKKVSKLFDVNIERGWRGLDA
jgi:hypothetical protein